MEFLYLIIGVVIIGTLALIFQRYRRKKALKLIQLDSQNLTDVAMEESLTNLKQLAVQAKAQGIKGYQQNRAFVVSDIWVKDDILHIDVSYLVNKATVEYVNDMNTLEQNN